MLMEINNTTLKKKKSSHTSFTDTFNEPITFRLQLLVLRKAQSVLTTSWDMVDAGGKLTQAV